MVNCKKKKKMNATFKITRIMHVTILIQPLVSSSGPSRALMESERGGIWKQA